MEKNIKRSFWTGRSQCLSCHKTLRWFELIPVVSYFLQRGRCRRCGENIPAWVISIECLNGLAWMVFGTLLFIYGYSTLEIGAHLIVITLFLMLAVEDIKSFTIPDRLSIPMIGLTLLVVVFLQYIGTLGLFVSLRESLMGGIIGMLFYMVQMMIPALFFLFRKKQFANMLEIVFLPLLFPFWLGIKALLGEKKADKWIPTVERMDHLPSWVGGGDVRLGLLIGLIAGPLYFWWVVGIGYVIGTLFWAFSRCIKKKNLDILPVAPLLFLGFCVTWVIRIFS